MQIFIWAVDPIILEISKKFSIIAYADDDLVGLKREDSWEELLDFAE
jgi:hypothetical protein